MTDEEFERRFEEVRKKWREEARLMYEKRVERLKKRLKEEENGTHSTVCNRSR